MALAVALCAAGSATGQTVAKQAALAARATAQAKLLERYDSNKNGKLDPLEIEQIARDRMMVHDTNKDGRVDAAELKVMREKSRKMPEQDDLARAMAREEALQAARLQAAANSAKKDPNQPTGGTK